tara:strand:- start:82 stop:1458 length:1377 start_codon:yes stop_codon:yes gene_type:complete
MKIDKIYIINLTLPNEHIVNKLNELPLDSCQYFILDACNGWEVVKGNEKPKFDFKVADWWKIDHEHNFYNREVTPGEIGCGLSHYECVKLGYDEGHETILILEEDFIYNGEWPSEETFNQLPKDWSMFNLARRGLWSENEEEILGDDLIRVGYSYNNQAYLVSRKGMKEILDSAYLDNVVVNDEFYPALHGTHDRQDAIDKFYNPDFRYYATRKEYFGQTSNPQVNSLTEFTPEYVRSLDKPVEIQVQTPNNESILDADDWEAWTNKYINPLLVNGEYDLITDEPAPHVYVFPLFTKAFCDELIALSETVEWTTDRHAFYPTTDNLLQELGMKDIYNRVINDYVRPYAINRFQLEGDSWNRLWDESFIIKYPHDQQAHLGVHHDFSNITTLVNLNPGEFEGGGTYFPKYKCLVNPKEIGMATLHPGNITHKHGARPTTKGTRYVVVSFITNSDHIASK